MSMIRFYSSFWILIADLWFQFLQNESCHNYNLTGFLCIFTLDFTVAPIHTQPKSRIMIFTLNCYCYLDPLMKFSIEIFFFFFNFPSKFFEWNYLVYIASEMKMKLNFNKNETKTIKKINSILRLSYAKSFHILSVRNDLNLIALNWNSINIKQFQKQKQINYK